MSKRKHITIAVSLAVGIASFIIWYKPKNETVLKPHDIKTNLQVSKPIERQSIQTAPPHLYSKSSPTIEEISPSKYFQSIALHHERILQYPAYSQPISSEHSPFLNWNHFEEVPVPILDGKDTASLSLNQYRHFYPDLIEVNFKTSANVVTASLEVTSVENQEILTALPLKEGGWYIQPKAHWPQELRLIAHVEFEQGEDIISADLQLYHSVASVIRVEQAFSHHTDMIIPVTLQIDKAGLYRIRSNLYQSKGTAIASLVQKQHLSEGEQTIELRAFKKVLQKGKVDYELRDIMIEYMSRFPGEKAQYGQSKKNTYPIGSFDSKVLSDKPYQMNESEVKQLEFLNNTSI